MNKFLAYAQLVRLPNTFTAMADICVGALAAIAMGLFADRWLSFLCLLVASTLLYWSGMVWNDFFDVEQDRKERPGRPIPSGRVTLNHARLLGIGLMLGGVLFAWLADLLREPGPWRSIRVAIILVIAVFLYDGVFKRTFAGPVLMGLCRFLNILLGLTLLGAWPPFWGWLIAIVVGSYIAGVTWFARTEATVSKQPMLIAAAGVMLASLFMALAVPALALQTPHDFKPSMAFPYLLALFGGYLGLAIWRAIQQPQPNRVQPAIKRAIFGLVVLDALLASALIGSPGLLLIVLLLPGIILGRWLYST